MPKKALKRRGSLSVSQNSSGSYASIGSNDDDDDFLNSSPDKDDNGDVEHSPLHNQGSFASEDGHGHANGENDAPVDKTKLPLRSASPPRTMYPPITGSYSGSFDLDDDDEDDVLEANLKRYNLDFSETADKGASLTDRSGNDANPFARGGAGASNSNRCTKVARYLWFSFQSVRQQARQRRAQLLLQQTERNWRQSLKICIMTNCDATDSGIMLVAATMVFWILALILFAKDPGVRRGMIVVGIVFFIIRVGTRPLYHFCLRQRQKRQLRNQQLEYSSQTNPDGKGQQHSSSDGHHYQQTLQSDGSLELHAMRGDSNYANRLPATSVGSDPTVAAI